MARARKTHGSAEPKTLNQLVLVGELRRDADKEDWVLYEDPPEEQDRLVVFANNDMLHNMSGAEILLMDGMFDVPELIYQLYTIHAKVGETSTPTQEGYKDLLQAPGEDHRFLH